MKLSRRKFFGLAAGATAALVVAPAAMSDGLDLESCRLPRRMVHPVSEGPIKGYIGMDTCDPNTLLFVQSSGRVGLNEPFPNAKLHVIGEK